MNTMEQRHETTRRTLTAVLAIAGLLVAVPGWGQTPETVHEAPAIESAAAAQTMNSIKQEQKAFRQARRQASLDRIRSSAKLEVPQQQGVSQQSKQALPAAAAEAPRQTTKDVAPQAAPQDKAVPVAALANILFSFRPDPRAIAGAPADSTWVSTPAYSATAEEAFSVEARIEGLTAAGQPMDVSASWNPADPSMVEVSPDAGNVVKITVRDAGESNLTVVAPGFSKDLWISATRLQGNAIEVTIFQ